MIYSLGLSYKNSSILSNKKTERKKTKEKNFSLPDKQTRSLVQSAEARRILSLLAGRSIKENDITAEAQGRPFLSGCELDFNISHSSDLTAVSFVKSGNLRTGCDIELIRKRSGATGIAETFFSETEKKYLSHNDRFDETRFYEIWTLKECYLKLHGLSVFDMAAVPSFITGDSSSGWSFTFDSPGSLPLLFSVYELSDNTGILYMAATVIEGALQLPEIKWFSSLSLACKIRAEIKAAPNPAQTVSPKR